MIYSQQQRFQSLDILHRFKTVQCLILANDVSDCLHCLIKVCSRHKFLVVMHIKSFIVQFLESFQHLLKFDSDARVVC